MFICTIVIKKYKQKMAILWYISIALQFLNKVLKVYEVNKCQNNCLVYHWNMRTSSVWSMLFELGRKTI